MIGYRVSELLSTYFLKNVLSSIIFDNLKLINKIFGFLSFIFLWTIIYSVRSFPSFQFYNFSSKCLTSVLACRVFRQFLLGS